MTPANNLANTSNAVSGLSERAHQTVDRVADKATPALERARSTAHTTIDKVADSAASGVDWAAENTRVLADKSSELTEVCSGYIRERPMVAVAGALAIGYLVGRLMR